MRSWPQYNDLCHFPAIRAKGWVGTTSADGRFSSLVRREVAEVYQPVAVTLSRL